jgi:hypothetical protein
LETDNKLDSFLKRVSGWSVIGGMTLVFAALYLLNFITPLTGENLTKRIWNWSETALFLTGLVVLAFHWRSVDVQTVLIGAALGVLSGISSAIREYSNPLSAVIEAALVWVIFMAGRSLFAKMGDKSQVSTFRPPPTAIFRWIGLGILYAIPLAVVNNLYFYFQKGAATFGNVLFSAVQAIKPGISEEVIFRYFVLALALSALKEEPRQKFALAVAVALSVVPHSLMHLPELFLVDPWMGVLMLIATSLLFGLPMAWLQIKHSFESAVAFHWFIDFVRFLFGY